jgi:hypothetical protein
MPSKVQLQTPCSLQNPVVIKKFFVHDTVGSTHSSATTICGLIINSKFDNNVTLSAPATGICLKVLTQYQSKKMQRRIR